MDILPLKDINPKILFNTEDAIEHLLHGGLLLYPTETCYALGCIASCNDAVNEIYKVKRRPAAKPLPMLAGNYRQAATAVDLKAAPHELIARFWPGPLTLILPAKKDVAQALRNRENKTAIRVTSCQLAARLAIGCGFPLVATSANLSGRQPARFMDDIDAEFLDSLCKCGPDCAIMSDNGNGTLSTATLPSTIVEPFPCGAGVWKLKVLRNGAIDKKLLAADNFELLE